MSTAGFRLSDVTGYVVKEVGTRGDWGIAGLNEQGMQVFWIEYFGSEQEARDWAKQHNIDLSN